MTEPDADTLARRLVEAGLLDSLRAGDLRDEFAGAEAAGAGMSAFAEWLRARGEVPADRLDAVVRACLAEAADAVAATFGGDGSAPGSAPSANDSFAGTALPPGSSISAARGVAPLPPDEEPTYTSAGTGRLPIADLVDPDAVMATTDVGVGTAGAASSVQRGLSFARYNLLGELGRGAMGVVYRAFDPMLRRLVALKVMVGAETATPDARRRFEKEALLAARVRHPGLVQVYEVGEFEGKLYYTMELVEGESLAEVVRREGRLHPRVALRIIRDAARALHAAHEQNLVHRDIKPANLMLTPVVSGGTPPDAGATALRIGADRHATFRVLITDFGIAKDVTGQTHLTRAGAVVGTPAYMSPEQAGSPERIGPGSDVYSLGVVLYHMLCGGLPFTETDPVRMLAAVLTREPPPLRDRVADLHRDLETLTLKAMMKDPGRRYRSAAEFADDIDRYLAGEMIHARPATWAYRWMRKARQHREAVWAGAGVLLAATAAVFHGVAWPRIVAWREAAQAAAERAQRESAAAAVLEAAERALRDGNADEAARRARELLATFADAAGRGEEVRAPEAHDLLARVHAGAGQPELALLERYRARRAALGSPGRETFFLRVIEDAVGQFRFDDAVTLAARLLRETENPAIAVQAQYWLGRGCLGRLDFGGAVRHLERALQSGTLAGTIREDAERRLAFSRRFARRAPRPARGEVLPPPDADFDGDGVGDVARIHDGRLTLTTPTPEGPREIAALDLPRHPGGKFPEKLRGDLAPSWLAIENVREEGAFLYVLRWRDGGLRIVSETALPAPVLATRAVDVDGDRVPELLLTTRLPERGLRLLDWDPETGRLSPLQVLPLGAPVGSLDALDFDGDGREEPFAFWSEWTGYGARVWGWDPEARALAVRHHEQLGSIDGLHRLERPGALPRFVAGVGWEERFTYPLRQIYGDDEFRRRFVPVGSWILEPRSDFRFDRRPLAALDWRRGGAGRCRVHRLRDADLDLLFTVRDGFGPLTGEEGEPSPATIFVHDLARDFAPVAVLVPAPGESLVGIVDDDGDGSADLILETPEGGRFLGVGAAEPADEAIARAAPGAAPGVRATPAMPPLLEFARDAERIGLTEEAISAYAEARARSESLAEVEAAFRGELAGRMKLGQPHAAAEMAQRVAEEVPDLEILVLKAALEELESAGAWGPAATLARRLQGAPDLDGPSLTDAVRREQHARERAAMAHRIRIVGPEAAPLDWLATTPFVATRLPDQSWRFQFASDANDRIAASVGTADQAWTLTGRVEVERLDWASGVGVGLGLEDPGLNLWRIPKPCLEWKADGETFFPIHRLFFGGGGPRFQDATLEFRGTRWPGVLSTEIEYRQETGRFAGRVVGEGAESRQRNFEIRAPEMSGAGSLLVGIESRGHWTPGFWAVLRIESLELRFPHTGKNPGKREPRTAAEHLLHANGRWILGDLDGARTLYDRAVRIAGMDRERQEQAAGEGLPPPWETPSLMDLGAKAGVDARIYRGLLRATCDDASGAREDLAAAWALDRERFLDVVRRCALPLLERPAEGAALRSFFAEQIPGGASAGPQARMAAARGLPPGGAEILLALIPGLVRVEVPVPRIRELPADHPAFVAGLRRGDLLLAVDGKPMTRPADVAGATERARSLGQAEVQVDFLRHGTVGRFTLKAEALELDLEEGRTQRLEFR